MALFSSIRARVQFGTLALAVVPLLIGALVIGFLSYQSSRDAVQARVTSQLESLRAVQAAQIKDYFESLSQTLRVTATNPTVISQFKRFRDSIGAVTEQNTIPIEQQRESLIEYFSKDFGAEFAKRNAGATSNIVSLVETLPDSAVNMQYRYISSNPNKLGEKNLMERLEGDTGEYAQAHAEFQPWVGEVVKQYGLYDFFLVDLNGVIVYTYFKEADFTTSLLNGPYADTNIAEAFVKASEQTDLSKIFLGDYRPYLPSYNDQAAFMSIPIVENGQRIGVFMIQAPIDKINRVMTFQGKWSEAGLGKSGQTLLIGANRRTRSISREVVENGTQYFKDLEAQKFDPVVVKAISARKSDIGTFEINSFGAVKAVAGESGSGSYINHLGKPVLAAYTPVQVLGLPWAILSEIDSKEALEPAENLLRDIAIAALGSALVLGIFGLLFSRRLAASINKPIARLQATVQEVAEGNLEARTQMKPVDELGELGQAFDNLLDDRVSQLVNSAHENEVLNNSVIEIMQSLGQLAQNDLTVKIPVTGDVTGAICDAINLVTTETSGALRQVLNISANVARASTQVRQRAAEVLVSAEKSGDEVSSTTRELAGAAEALTAIASQAQSANLAAESAISATGQALKIVSETVRGVSLSRDQIRETEKRLKRLGERSQEITSVVNIIGQIAERTSVLALNAGMQAAAAGEAGRGFAMVADEVKRLAESARDATRQIGTLVNGIQADSGETIRTMNETITQVVDISKLAERAGEQMALTLTATDGLVVSVREIAGTTASQAKASDVLLKRARTIEQSNQETMSQLSAQREETNRLMQYSKALVDTVRMFKLPGEST